MPATTQAPHRAHTVVSSPVGPLTLTSVDGVLVGLYLDRQRYLPSAEASGEPDASQFTEAARQLEAYFAGQLTEFTVPVTLIGTAFQRSVWTLLRTVPFGETTTYGELANLLGRPTAARAVGAANARNPIGIVVPCHRVVGSTGGLTGYSGGLERKEYLLALERNRGVGGRVPDEFRPNSVPALAAMNGAESLSRCHIRAALQHEVRGDQGTSKRAFDPYLVSPVPPGTPRGRKKGQMRR